MSAELIRVSTVHERLTIKAAVRRALNLAGGGECFSHATRVDAPRLCRYASQNDPQHMPVDVVLELDREAGSPVIVGQLAALLGYQLVHSKSDPRPVDGALAARLARETSEVTITLIEALNDGAISPRERNVLLKEITEAQAALHDLSARLQAER